MSTSFNDLVFSFTLEESLEHWQLQTLHGTATDPTLGEVATLSGYLIYRCMLDGNFLVMMDMESDEIHEFGIALKTSAQDWISQRHWLLGRRVE